MIGFINNLNITTMSQKRFYANFLIDLGYASTIVLTIAGLILVLIANFPA